MTPIFEALRYVNLAVSALLAVAMLLRSAAFLRASVASRYGRLALFAWVTSIGCYGTLETLVQRAPAGPRVPALTGALIVTAWYVTAEIRYDGRERARLAELRRCPAMISA
jgi:hypothetical protein